MAPPDPLIIAWLRYLVAWIWTLGWGVTGCVLALLIGPTRMWRLCRRPWARSTLAIVGVTLHVEGAEHLVRDGLYIANHQSLIDIVLMPAVLPREARLVAKRQLLWVPFFGWAFAAGGAVLIDRKRPKLALEQLFAGVDRLPAGWSLLIFPEGTRSRDGALRPLRRGAIALACRTHRPLVPIAIDGAREVVAMGDFLVRAGDVRVSIGPPIDTTAWTLQTLPDHVAVAALALDRNLARARGQRPAAPAPVAQRMHLSSGEGA